MIAAHAVGRYDHPVAAEHFLLIQQGAGVVDEAVFARNHFVPLPLDQTLAIHLNQGDFEIEIDHVIGIKALLLGLAMCTGCVEADAAIGLLLHAAAIEQHELIVGDGQITQQSLGIVSKLSLKVVSQRHVSQGALLLKRHFNRWQQHCGGRHLRVGPSSACQLGRTIPY